MHNLITLYLHQGHNLPPPQHLYDYILSTQGLIKRSSNSHTEADLLLAALPIGLELIGLNLHPYPLRGIQLKLPRIPGHILQDILADARQDISREFMYLVRFDALTGRYVIDRPEQNGTGIHVGYNPSANSDVVLEIHSHHTMPAFFSPTDNRDEQGGRWYAVMGRIHQEQPQLALRLGMYGQWAFNLPGTVLFEHLGPFEVVWVEPAAGQLDSGEWAGGENNWLSKLLPWRR